jgi:4-amino-4-deoxy-L-arabinose transferase-like glycosyltransferase
MARPDEADEPQRDSEPPLTPPGNTPRPRQWWLAAAALLPAFVLMTTDTHFAVSVPLGLLSCAVAAWAMLDALGSFDDALPLVALPVRVKSLMPRLIEFVGSSVALIAALRLAVAGLLPWPMLSGALLVTGGALWVVVAGYRVIEALGFTERKLFERHGFWLFALSAVLYLPLLGSFSLIDPWETHYGEVAREMLARDDWISLWWAQDGWFWSKPILDFWLQGLSFSLLGVEFVPDRMLIAAGAGRVPQPEWAARLPVFVLTCIGGWALYRAVAQAFGRRAGFLGALALLSMPYWFLLARQSMTDMPYVAPLAAALGFVLLGLQSDPEQTVRPVGLQIGRRVFGLSAYHALFGLLLVTVLPQILYLASRHLSLHLVGEPLGFRWHLDEFFSGSGGGNCGLPGNEGCRRGVPVDRIFQPGLAALLWSAVLGVLLWANRGERRVQRLFFLAAWYFTALSAMAKGAPGLVLPLVVALVTVGATLRFRDLPRLELPALGLIVACVALPWYVQMYVRHGSPFTDRLLIHDMYKRAFAHVHDTNTGDDTSFRYYLWQLGYGLFPWTGLAAGGLLLAQREGDEARSRKAETLALLVLWFVVVLGMFSVTQTKFHHYVLPGVPPLAMLTGILLDRAFGDGAWRPRRPLLYYALLGLGSGLVLFATARLFPGDPFGSSLISPRGSLSWLQAAGAGLVGLAAIAAGIWRCGPERSPPSTEPSSPVDRWLVAVLALAAAVAVVLAGRDMFASVELNGSARLMHLFTYNYKRTWPTTLDFGIALKAFTLIATLCVVLLAVPRLQRHAVVLLSSVALWWTAWGVDVYLVRLAPHWGQRETMVAYYARRAGPEEPLVAYQMNWKGENFYTGNRIPAFVQTGAKFKTWLGEQRKKGVKVLFFSTEHTRLSSLKNELGNVKKFEIVTKPELNNKFFIARVEL